jgi:RsiW-degrading membrane proteinase PrsW (M82 family)
VASAEPWVLIVATALIGVVAIVVLVQILRFSRDDKE